MSEPLYFNWSDDKNKLLKEKRGVSFDEVVLNILSGCVLDVIDNPNYPGQRKYVIHMRNYVWIVPFIQEDSNVFLKTVYPDRKATRDYLGP